MIIDELFEAPQQCPECGGISFSDLILAEKKDACYHKVKASAKVWPSAYASGRLVQCRKKGAANYGNKSEGVAEGMEGSVVFSGTGDNGGKYEIIQSGPNDFMIHANGNHIDTYGSLQRAISVLKNEVPGLQQGVAENNDPYEPEAYDEFVSDTYSDDNPEDEQGVAETRVGQVPMTLKPGETDNLEPEDFEGFKKLPAYKQGQQAQQSRGKDLIQQSPYTYQSDQDWAYRNGAFDQRQAATSADFTKRGPLTTENTLDEKSVSQAQFRTMAGAAHNPKFAKKVGISQDVAQEFNRADKKSNYKKLPVRATEGASVTTTPGSINPGGAVDNFKQQMANNTEVAYQKKLSGVGEGEQQKGADYRDPKEVDYDDEYDAMVARVKKLAGLGPMKTVWDPAKRQYRNMPTAQQPKK